jgi:S-adenosylmethionine decarboxylase
MNPYFVLRQYIGDYINCNHDPKTLNSPEFLRVAAEKAIELSNTSILKQIEHQFTPQGYTLLMILADSSLILHSWPEEKFISVEIFTCAERANPERGLIYLKEVLKPEKFKLKKIKRT